jgi:hypothetical protein
MELVAMTEEEKVDLRTYIEAIMNEREKSTDDRFKAIDDRFGASDVAVLAALVAKDKAVDAAFLAAREASAKSEEAQQIYNTGHNDLLRKMDEQYNHMMPREEVIARINAIDAKIEQGRAEIGSLRESRSQSQGTKENKSANAIYIIAGAGMFISILGVIVSVALHFIH